MTEGGESVVGLVPAGGAVFSAAIGAALIGWSATTFYYIGQKRASENTTPDKMTPYPWYIWLGLILGIILVLASGGGVYYKKKKI
jgi:hypothetical protein